MWNMLDGTGGVFPSDAEREVERVAPVLPLFGEPVDDSLMGWQERALGARDDPGGLFFPEKGGSTREAKKVCTGCEVRAECLEYALEHDERFGIWGGALRAGAPQAQAPRRLTTGPRPGGFVGVADEQRRDGWPTPATPGRANAAPERVSVG